MTHLTLRIDPELDQQLAELQAHVEAQAADVFGGVPVVTRSTVVRACIAAAHRDMVQQQAAARVAAKQAEGKVPASWETPTRARGRRPRA